MNVILCGMPGSGKSYLGKRLAENLNRTFIDTDERVVLEHFKITGVHATCRAITLKEGESFFRDLESAVIRELATTAQNSILALGGGALCRPENIPLLKSLGRIIYLKAPSYLLLERLMKKDSLPSYVCREDIEGSFNALIKKRLPLYEQHSDYSVDIDSENVDELLTHLKQRCKEL